MAWEQAWGAEVCGIEARLFAWRFGKDVFHGDGNDVEGEVGCCERFIESIVECIDHTLGEGMEEDDAFVCGGDGRFSQSFKVKEDVEG